jgi:hypothetical protein
MRPAGRGSQAAGATQAGLGRLEGNGGQDPVPDGVQAWHEVIWSSADCGIIDPVSVGKGM